MPFRGQHASSPYGAQHNNAEPQSYGALSGLLQATQTLGSLGAPAGNLRSATDDSTTPRTDTLYLPGAKPRDSSAGGPLAASPSLSSHRAVQSDSSIRSPQASSAPQFDSAARSQAYSRQLDELHISSPPASVGRGGQKSQQEYLAGGAPRISLELPTPNVSSHPAPGQSPGALQSGSRPEPLSSRTTPQLSNRQTTMAQDPYSSPSRPALTHNYSRSSPSGAYESQSFTPFSSTANNTEGGAFQTPFSQKYTPQNQSRNVPNAPLGLADIRPRADSTQGENLPGANPYSYDGTSATPTNSNYLAPWAIYAFDWCKWPTQGQDAGKVAVGSYLEDGHNFVGALSQFWTNHDTNSDQIQILESRVTPSTESYSPSAPKYGLEFSKIAEATHSYPVTRLLWEPPSSQKQSTDLLATSGDHLRLWSLPSDTPISSPGNSISRSANHGRDLPPTKLTPLALLSNSKTPEHTAPLTSLDWNTVSPSLIITSSIDTTCTIWDIPTLTAKTQLIAHDKEVFDVRFCANSVDVFVSCGADGSVRMFDLRSLEHSTIIYEPTAKDDKGKLQDVMAVIFSLHS